MKRARKLGPPKRYLFSYSLYRTIDQQTLGSKHHQVLTSRSGVPKVELKHTGSVVIYNISLRRIK